jgi:hypothetical protein
MMSDCLYYSTGEVGLLYSSVYTVHPQQRTATRMRKTYVVRKKSVLVRRENILECNTQFDQICFLLFFVHIGNINV